MIELDKQEKEPTQEEIASFVNSVYDYAADLIINQKYSCEDTKGALIERGLNATDAEVVINVIMEQIMDAKRKAAKKDIIYGLIWGIAGTIATIISHGKYIFMEQSYMV